MSKFKDSKWRSIEKPFFSWSNLLLLGGLLRGEIYSRSSRRSVRNVAPDLLSHLLQQPNGQLMSMLMIPINLWFFCVGSQFPGFFYNVIKTGVIVWIYARSGSLETIPPLTHTSVLHPLTSVLFHSACPGNHGVRAHCLWQRKKGTLSGQGSSGNDSYCWKTQRIIRPMWSICGTR